MMGLHILLKLSLRKNYEESTPPYLFQTLCQKFSDWHFYHSCDFIHRNDGLSFDRKGQLARCLRQLCHDHFRRRNSNKSHNSRWKILCRHLFPDRRRLLPPRHRCDFLPYFPLDGQNDQSGRSRAFQVNPIGYFHSSAKSFYDLPRQPGLLENAGTIELLKGHNFEQALEGLEGFDLIWVVFLFHKSKDWKAKVLPPRGGKKQGVFATRSPHRPNFIGFSPVKLEAINGLSLSISNHDLLDGTPILDLKPYLNYSDSLHSTRQGWLDELPLQEKILVEWSPKVQEQLEYLELNWNCHLKEGIKQRLSQSHLPYPNNRIKLIAEDEYELAYKTWRIIYSCKEGIVHVQSLKSGYDQATLSGQKESKWKDVPVHVGFVKRYT